MIKLKRCLYWLAANMELEDEERRTKNRGIRTTVAIRHCAQHLRELVQMQ